MKRILSLDGGGIRGVFTLEVLLELETQLRQYYEKHDPEKAKDFVLRKHFDFFAGTSTGAIIATCLAWGMPVSKVLDLYIEHGRKMFQPVPWYKPRERYLVNKYESGQLAGVLRDLFHEDGKPATLGSQYLLRQPGESDNKLLLVVLRNHTTGSAWPLTNNPDAIYNDRSRPDCNLDIPLWELIRASTAAPTYFKAAQILLGKKESIFVDGSITPYSNPALISALTVLLPGYMVNWTPGPDNIHMTSVGTITFSSELKVQNQRLWLGYYASQIPVALLTGTAWQQDYMCRFLGDCLFGEKLDSEVGDLRLMGDLKGKPLPGQRLFSYVRYNRTYKLKEMKAVLQEHPDLARIDAVDAIPYLRDIGKAYAKANVNIDHLKCE